MMKNKCRQKEILHAVMVAAILLLAPTSLCGQHTHAGKTSLANMAKSATWLDKDAHQKLKNIAEWQEVKSRYDTSVSERDSMNRVSTNKEQKKGSVIKRQKALQDQLTFMQYTNKGESRQADYMYSQYDTPILQLHQGMFGSTEIEKTQDALLLCHKNEQVLHRKYNKMEVDKAREAIKTAKDVVPEVYSNLNDRLGQYATMSKNLRNALTTANEIRPEPDNTRSQHMVERYTKEFFAEIEKNLDPTLLDPVAYPYLYRILQKAIATKLKDPSKDIKELIDEL